MRVRCGLIAVCLSLVLGLTLAAHAAPEDRKTLVLRGRVTDAQGTPIAGARISARGTRRANAPSDDDGQFEISLSLGAPAGLARNPLAVRVRAERRGWRLALPDGGTELGLELRMVPGGDSLALCEVRCNHPGVTWAITRVLALGGEVTGVAIVNFIGTPGEEIAVPETLHLPVVDRIAIPGLRAPAAAPPAKVVAPVASRKEKSAGAEASEVVKAKPKEKKPKREPERRDPPGAVIPPMPSPALPVPPSDAERELVEAKRRAERERSAARDAARRARDEAQKRDRLQRLAPAEEKARAIEAEATRGAAEEELRRVREAQDKRWGDLRHEVQMIGASNDTTSAPPVAALDGLAGAPARPEQRASDQPRLTAARDTVSVRPPRALPDLPAAPVSAPAGGSATSSQPAMPAPTSSSPSTPTPSRATAPARIPASPPAQVPALPPAKASASPPAQTPASRPAQAPVTPPATAGAGTRTVAPATEYVTAIPRPESGPRSRARPLVIRTGEPSPEITETPPAASDSCSCRIEGTVEVDSDRPLTDRTPVAVSLVWHPAIADTIELFMGSPRKFELPAAPCGPQRLRLVNLGGTRFDVISRQAMAGFRCERGALRQFRLVLRPR